MNGLHWNCKHHHQGWIFSITKKLLSVLLVVVSYTANFSPYSSSDYNHRTIFRSLSVLISSSQLCSRLFGCSLSGDIRPTKNCMKMPRALPTPLSISLDLLQKKINNFQITSKMPKIDQDRYRKDWAYSQRALRFRLYRSILFYDEYLPTANKITAEFELYRKKMD